ncbi:hypothetical protein ASF48_09285 [Rathayibacter sp. Leaf299]|uniref:hypothetical protein n=1 Tax=Rathayibacter sp. Leaf299 TaxID=1736328 RepID=UPI0006FB9772|nr:hypothetical protein [Rathayibacter sp. Leaf299]KQQ20773.1 hypothetical protein ASF48_09285 [Rathayibacter sp. Leaf299]
MKTNHVLTRTAAAAIGALLLLGTAATAAAAETELGNDSVDVSVDIAPLPTQGALSMTVGGSGTVLTEDGSTALVREFTGELPTVTVTDTRAPEDVPEGAGWYVVGSATAFVGSDGQPEIGADHLGWTPRLLDGGESGLVAEGEQVNTVLDTGDDSLGLVDQEFLAITDDSAAVITEGQWTATADLVLKTEPTVAAGDYSATLTLSLFE